MVDERQGAASLSRVELYELVWSTPMVTLAKRFGISGTGLAKICRRLDVPYPPRGHWAKLAAGKKSERQPLPRAAAGTPSTVEIVSSQRVAPPVVAPPALQEQLSAKPAVVPVPERLNRPHAVIAKWLADYERSKREARQARDPWHRDILKPAEFTDQDRRRHRILHALFKELERRGAKVTEDDRRRLLVEVVGEQIEIDLRGKLKQVRRPLSDKERDWRSSNRTGFKRELQPTGMLLFAIKTYLPDGLRREWLEKPDSPLEGDLPEIVATLLAAGPLLADLRRQREERAQAYALEQRRLEEERQRRQQDHNRWRRFIELAELWRQTALAREFLSALLERDYLPAEEVSGRPLSEWIEWAQERTQSVDPLAQGVGGVFEELGKVTSWIYR